MKKSYIIIAAATFALLLIAFAFFFTRGSNKHYLDLDGLHDPKNPNYGCVVKQECGDLVGVDCDSAADGPFYYVNKKTEEILAFCGGYCMGGQCEDCPPKEWTCK